MYTMAEKKAANKTKRTPKLDPELSKLFIRKTPTNAMKKKIHCIGLITSLRNTTANKAAKIGDI